MKAKLMGLVAVGSLMMGAAGVNAADLVTYSFTGANSGTGASAGTADGQPANGSASVVSAVGMTATTTIGTDRFAVTGAAVGALDTGKYWALTITPSGGYEVNLTGIRFLTDRNGSGFESVTVRTSVDSYVANKASVTRSSADSTSDESHPSQALSGLSNLGAVTLRLYAHGAEQTTGVSVIDNLVIEGTITPTNEVPEPATIGLLGLAGVALLRRRA